MNKITIQLIGCILILTIIDSLAAQTHQYQDSTLRKLAVKGIDLATNLHYREADAVFQKIIQIDPKNPCGYFLRSATYFYMFSEDTKNETIGYKFRDLSYEAVEVAEARLEEDEIDINAMFFLGGAYGSLGRYYAMTKSYLNAYWYGKKGVGYLEDVVEADSSYYDAYLGLGIYHYLADVLPRFVKILSFLLGLDGDKELGIKELNLAATKGFYTKTEAMFFLGTLYTYRERKYEKAIVIFKDLLKKYPNNPGALSAMGRCYSRMGKCDLAISAFEKILLNKEDQSRLPRGSTYYHLGELYYKRNDFERAKDNYLLAIASDTAIAGKRRWIYPRSHLKAARCYEILGDVESAKYHLRQVLEVDNERAYGRAQEQLDEPMRDIDILLIKAINLIECNQYDQALSQLFKIEERFESVDDPHVKQKLFELNFRKAEVYYKNKTYDQAIPMFKKLTLTSIDDEELEEWVKYWSYFYIGSCYKALEEYEYAAAAYDEAEDSDDQWLLENIEDARKELPEKYR